MRFAGLPAAGVVAAVLALGLAGCGPAAGSGQPATAATLPETTAVRGSVTAGPTCPVVREPPDPACGDRPVSGAVLLIADQAGAEVARVESNVDGTFAVDLVPGAYRLTALPVEGLMGTPSPMDFEVEAGRIAAELHVSYDTGIR